MKVKKTTTYRDLVDEFIEMPRIRDALDLDLIRFDSCTLDTLQSVRPLGDGLKEKSRSVRFYEQYSIS